MASKFYKIPTGDKTIDRIQDGVSTALTSLTNSQITQGRLIPDVQLETTGTEIAHGLGRPYSGYIIVRSSVAAGVYDDVSADDALFIRLIPDVAVRVSIWVF